ncbi:MAG: hypothetical protein JW843_02570, partial [Candidatus Aminicenantes bacterium]|nr:hypothetical protein [Candidatus Aminicenantes bacterium]
PFERVMDPDGRLSGPVFDSLRDRDGFLWLATDRGLIRTDGIHYRVYRSEAGNPGSLDRNEVRSLLCDRAGRLWAGTTGGALNRFDPGKGNFTRFSPPGRTVPAEAAITALFEDERGRIWAGTSRGDIWRLDRAGDGLTLIRTAGETEQGKEPAGIGSIRAGDDGSIWLAAGGEGLLRFDLETGKGAPFRFENGEDPPAGAIVSLEDDGKGGFLAAGAGGILSLGRVEGSWKILDFRPKAAFGIAEGDTVRAFQRTGDGGLWLGTENGLLVFVPAGDGSHRIFRHDPDEPGSLIGGRILHLRGDPEGILWVGSSSGLAKHVPGKHKFENLQIRSEEGAGTADIVSVAKDASEAVWIGCRDGRLSRWDRETGTLRHVRLPEGRPGEFVSGLHCPGPGRIWLGTSTGRLLELNIASGLFVPLDASRPFAGKGEIIGFSAGLRGIVWAGIRDAGVIGIEANGRLRDVFRTDPGEQDGPAGGPIAALEAGPDGRVWIALENGLDLLDPSSGRFRRILNGDDFEPESGTAGIRTIHVSAGGDVWLGTRLGLFRYREEDDSLLAVNRAFQLQPHPIQGICGDDRGYLWIGVEGLGLLRGEPDRLRFAYYSLGSGLHSLDFNPSACRRAADGEMFFGGYGGLTYFDPGEFREAPLPPRVAVVSVRGRDNRLFREDPGASLLQVAVERRDFPLRIEPVSLSLADPTKNQYAWVLEGGGPRLNYLAVSREIVLPELPPGRHIVRVFASNSDGVWNMEGARLIVRVRSGFRRLWPLPALMGIAALAWLLSSGKRTRAKRSLHVEAMTDLAPLASKYSLSPREVDVLRLVLQGRTNKEIEAALFISVETVKTHIQRIYRKTGVRSRLELINRAAREASDRF